ILCRFHWERSMNQTFLFPFFCFLKGVNLWNGPAAQARTPRLGPALLLITILALLAAPRAYPQVLDTIGVTSLRSVSPGLVGTGIPVAQAEAGDPSWEVNPAAVGQPVSLFTWTSASGSS